MAVQSITNGTVLVHIPVDYTAASLTEIQTEVAANPGTYSEKTFRALDTGLYHYVDAQDNVVSSNAVELSAGASATDGPADLSSGAVTYDITAANEQNLDPNGNDTTDGISILKFINTAGVNRLVDGLVRPSTAKTLVVYNEGPNNVRLRNNNANGDIDNRFDLNANITIGNKEGLWLFYDTVVEKWKALNI